MEQPDRRGNQESDRKYQVCPEFNASGDEIVSFLPSGPELDSEDTKKISEYDF